MLTNIIKNVRGKSFRTSDWNIANTTSGNALNFNWIITWILTVSDGSYSEQIIFRRINSESPYYDSGWLIVDLTNESEKALRVLIKEIRKGQELFHLDDNNKIISKFSLKGSAASLTELEKCVREQGFWN